jgi:hypothetical protein
MAETIPTAHPSAAALDMALGQAWWAATVPGLWAVRKIGLFRPTLPKSDLNNKIVVVTGCNRGSKCVRGELCVPSCIVIVGQKISSSDVVVFLLCMLYSSYYVTWLI